MSKMTLEQVLDALRNSPNYANLWSRRLADAIDAHLTSRKAKGDDEWPIRGKVWQRGDEWVLDLEGVYDDQAFYCRHTEPLTTPRADVAGLPSLYADPQQSAQRLAEQPKPEQAAGGCTACEPDGVFATDGTGPWDCYACGKKAKPEQSDHLRDATKMTEQAVGDGVDGETTVRYCPECSHLGEVHSDCRDCCPDGSKARYIPEHIAEAAQRDFRASITPRPAPVEVSDGVTFEQWYADNAFDLQRNPIGGRECALQRVAWNAALALSLPDAVKEYAISTYPRPAVATATPEACAGYYLDCQCNACKAKQRLDHPEPRPVATAGDGVADELVARLKVAARALVRDRKVYAEDVETLRDVLRIMESLAAHAEVTEAGQSALAIEWANIHEAESNRYLQNQSFTNARRHREIAEFLRDAALASRPVEAAQGGVAEIRVDPIAVADEPDAHQVRIVHGGQRFDVGMACDTKADAEWYADQLRHAIAQPRTAGVPEGWKLSRPDPEFGNPETIVVSGPNGFELFINPLHPPYPFFKAMIAAAPEVDCG